MAAEHGIFAPNKKPKKGLPPKKYDVTVLPLQHHTDNKQPNTYKLTVTLNGEIVHSCVAELTPSPPRHKPRARI